MLTLKKSLVFILPVLVFTFGQSTYADSLRDDARPVMRNQQLTPEQQRARDELLRRIAAANAGRWPEGSLHRPILVPPGHRHPGLPPVLPSAAPSPLPTPAPPPKTVPAPAPAPVFSFPSMPGIALPPLIPSPPIPETPPAPIPPQSKAASAKTPAPPFGPTWLRMLQDWDDIRVMVTQTMPIADPMVGDKLVTMKGLEARNIEQPEDKKIEDAYFASVVDYLKAVDGASAQVKEYAQQLKKLEEDVGGLMLYRAKLNREAGLAQ
jgi:hypothetical protein